MILIDFSQSFLANTHQHLKDNPVIEPNLLRSQVLNSIRKINRDFGKQYGRIVICTDNQHYWRKDVFRHYKANRKKDSEIDWDLVHKIRDELRDELRENFPYKVMNVSMTEADDVIGVITRHYHTQEKILIISGDHDFLQLQVYPDVDQYNTIKNDFMKEPNPVLRLKEHILRGDKDDGVPNFLSPDDVFVTGGRQASIYETKLEVWVTQEPKEFCNETTFKNYERNKQLVDLSQIPAAVENSILEEFARPIIGVRNKIYTYLIRKRMKNLLELISEF